MAKLEISQSVGKAWSIAVLSPLLLACTQQTTPNTTPGDERSQQETTFLAEAVAQTPYSAVVQLRDVEVRPVADDPSMQWHIYSGNVLVVLRGEQAPGIRYALAVELGEEPVLPNQPVLLTLCRLDKELSIAADYYWPGVGAQFEATPGNIATAHASAAGVPVDQVVFAHCE